MHTLIAEPGFELWKKAQLVGAFLDPSIICTVGEGTKKHKKLHKASVLFKWRSGKSDRV
jgi:hypothetical protein